MGVSVGGCWVVYVVVVERAVWHAEKPRVSTQNASVCTFKTSPCAPAPRRTCVSTCARGARTHGDVLHVHTEASGVDTRSHRQFCLPRKAHVQFSLAPERFTKRNERILPIFLSLGGGCRDQHVRDSSNHSIHLTKLFNSSSPEGNCGGNQL